ncbi:MAG: hypothetical protein IPN17_35785 [Deltaproteobacteria bacterium]|nr:hypothetical protein [Deltaproteobacteria bacterium]
MGGAWTRSVRTRDLEAAVHVEDQVVIAVRMLPVLQGDAMGATLREVLAGQGWEAQPDGTMTRVFGAVTATLDAGASSVTVSRAADAKVSAMGSAVVQEGDDADEARASVAEGRREGAQAKRAQATGSWRRRTPRRSPGRSPRCAALQEALNRVYRRALEERARQLGEVESIDERGDVRGGYEVTVVVKA